MTLKTSAKERKTYPQFIFVVSVEGEVVESSWTNNVSLVHVFEIAKDEVSRIISGNQGMCTVWQKSEDVTSSGTPKYVKVFYATTNETSIIPTSPQGGFLANQYRNFDSSKWYDNRLNPIRITL